MISIDANILLFGFCEAAPQHVKDFEGTGFTRVWNPIAGDS